MKKLACLLLFIFPHQVVAQSFAANVPYSEFRTKAALTLYATTTGNDANHCKTLDKACRTITGAFRRTPHIITNNTLISLGPGTFDPAYVSGYDIRPGSYLALVGSTTPSTITGLQTGTIASGTANNGLNGVFGVYNVTGAGWTTDALVGKLFVIETGTGAGTVRVINSNTATAVTVAGTGVTIGANAATFSNVEQATFITSGVALPATYDSAAIANQINLLVSNVRGGTQFGIQGSFFIERIKFSGTNYGVYIGDAAGVVVQQNWFSSNSVYGVGISMPSMVRIDDNYATSNGTAFVGAVGSASFVNTQRNVVSGGGAGYLFTSGTYGAVKSGSIKNATAGVRAGSGSAVVVQGTKIDCVTPGTRIGVNANFATSSFPGILGADITLSNADVSNCGTALNVAVPGGGITGIGLAGTGNTVAMKANTGGAIKLSSSSTITGTTEISVDGTSFTVAAMRAASPKCVPTTPNVYGSMVFE